jgi:dipicolinate synthase subunit A
MARLASLLSAGGRSAARFAGAPPPGLEADYIILPLPLSSREGFLNAPEAEAPVPLGRLFASLGGARAVFAGRVDAASRALAHEAGVELLDYYEREELAVLNAAATAEGALALAMRETAGTLCRSRALIAGFGRIGRLLALRLRALGADVTAAARSPADRAWAEAFGCRAAELTELPALARESDIVFNTVPAPVFTEPVLAALPAGTPLIDLASRPGGTDFEAAAKLGKRAIHALSLPGEAAPEAAGAAIGRAVLGMLAERGDAP